MDRIRREIIKGSSIVFATRYLNVVINIFIIGILARVCTPEDFGIIAVISVLINFFRMLSEFGIGPGIVQHQSVTENDYMGIFALSAAAGILSSLALFISSEFVANVYSDSRYIQVAKILSVTLLFYTLSIVPLVKLRKEKKFLQVGLVGIVANVISGIIGIVLAYSTSASYLALAWKSVANSILFFFLYVFAAKFEFKAKAQFTILRSIFNYSAKQLLFNIINYFSRNADKLLIGKYLGTETLGYYEKSYRTMLYPLENLTQVITPVIHPVLSKYQREKDVLFENAHKLAHLLAIVGFPLSVFLFFASAEIIYILYGPAWAESIPVFRILSISIGFQMVLSSTGGFFQASGRTDLLLATGIQIFAFMAISLVVGILKNNVIILAWMISCSYIISSFFGVFLLVRFGLERSFASYLKSLLSPVIIAGIILIGLYVVNLVISIDNVLFSMLAKLIVSIVLFIGPSYLLGELSTINQNWLRK